LADSKAGAIKEHYQLDVMSGSFKANLDKFDQEKTYLIYCKRGMRNRKPCKIRAKVDFNSFL
jgi:rhodanese-related sulfurtransferase